MVLLLCAFFFFPQFYLIFFYIYLVHDIFNSGCSLIQCLLIVLFFFSAFNVKHIFGLRLRFVGTSNFSSYMKMCCSESGYGQFICRIHFGSQTIFDHLFHH